MAFNNKTISVLFICSRKNGKINSFILEQVDSLKQQGVDAKFLTINKRGILGYLNGFTCLRALLRKNNYHIIHAHYGLSGLIATLQRKIPVVITYHGSDVNMNFPRKFSFIASRLACHNIFVEESLASKLKIKNNYSVIPCGIDLTTFKPIDKNKARHELGLIKNENIILFSSSFSNPVKNYNLAKKALSKVENTSLIEMKGYSRNQIKLLMNASDALLVTSFSEGSPQVVKEAMACNLPVISTAVGDVPELLKNVSESFITSYNADEIAQCIKYVLHSGQRSNGSSKIKRYDNSLVAGKIKDIYKTLLTN